MSIKIVDGNLFTTRCQTIVNTVNCVGVMGAGIALECKLRYPEMFDRYKSLCEAQQIKPGLLWLYKAGDSPTDIDRRWILNFPTKLHWRFPSQMKWISDGLDKFVEIYKEKSLSSVAFPVLGGLNGGLDPEAVIALMSDKLNVCEIPIEIYKYNPRAYDDQYQRLKAVCSSMTVEEFSNKSGMSRRSANKIYEGIRSPDIYQLNQLARVDGIGGKTLEAAFAFVRQRTEIQMAFEL